MKISKRLLAVIGLISILAIGVGYAIFTTQYVIPNNTVSIAGIGVTVNWWGESETTGALVTSTQFGLVTPPAVGYAVNPTNPAIGYILLIADCNGVSEAITWTSSLDPAVGTISIQGEKSVGNNNYEWFNLPQGYVMTNHNTLGFRPSSYPGVSADFNGHLRLVFTPAANPPHGDFTFSITITGTQV
jgi:hypothetical protein